MPKYKIQVLKNSSLSDLYIILYKYLYIFKEKEIKTLKGQEIKYQRVLYIVREYGHLYVLCIVNQVYTMYIVLYVQFTVPKLDTLWYSIKLYTKQQNIKVYTLLYKNVVHYAVNYAVQYTLQQNILCALCRTK